MMRPRLKDRLGQVGHVGSSDNIGQIRPGPSGERMGSLDCVIHVYFYTCSPKGPELVVHLWRFPFLVKSANPWIEYSAGI
jgi:hypothetical protein